MLKKIISGGQTGADQGALIGAKQYGFPTGGFAAKGFKTELGAMPTLASTYDLVECERWGYPHRTKENVAISHGTVLFGNMDSVGSRLTIRFCKDLNKPYCINPDMQFFMQWIVENNIRVLNVAGNRESVNKGIAERVRLFINTYLHLTFDEILD